eukprot:1160646-Pelagomonas_calceolata.AAC.3
MGLTDFKAGNKRLRRAVLMRAARSLAVTAGQWRQSVCGGWGGGREHLRQGKFACGGCAMHLSMDGMLSHSPFASGAHGAGQRGMGCRGDTIVRYGLVA